MTQEEKAKAYDEALERARKLKDAYYEMGGCYPNQWLCEEIFPELKESEDEKIRKALKEYFINSFQNNGVAAICGVHIKYILAWVEKQGKIVDYYEDKLDECACKYFNKGYKHALEKQGEQKPVPKFKIGDTMRTLQEAKDGFTDGMPVVVSIDEEYYHCTNELIAIKDQDKYEYPPMNRRQKHVDKIEQKPTEWSEKTKSLDKLETYILSIVPNRPLDAVKVDSKNIRFLINKEQKPWSEEDEKQARQIERIVHNDGCTQKLQKQIADWFKSLKDRVQPKQEWSEEDEKMIGNIRSIIEKYAFSQSAVDVNGELCEKEYIEADNWLKSLRHQKQQQEDEWSDEDKEFLELTLSNLAELKDRYGEGYGKVGKCIDWLKSLQPQPIDVEAAIAYQDGYQKALVEFSQKHQEWTEDDINMIDWLIRCCEKEHEELCNDKYGHQDIVSDLKRDCRKKWDWLESLKDKAVSQKHWKPSDEQLIELRHVISGCSYDIEPLVEIEKHLKKLREK